MARSKPSSARALLKRESDVAQIDQRRQAVNPACFAGHVEKRTAGNGMSTGTVQELWSARALLKRVSEGCSERPEKASGQPGMF